MSERTRVVREPQRGVYDRETIYKILDEGFVCHVGFRGRWAAVCDSDDVRADWGRDLFSRLGGKPDAAQCRRRDCTFA